ncbi:unnamed protein product [Brassicogethes aeneus]|uniref:Integral membrane protein 2 n=1 Tax=Brassicogethes aeneus TaxID=1431903 RepID=A0A9P0B655_BRAAE|nr:unnamed protein product [Brassicogethes aeneus]
MTIITKPVSEKKGDKLVVPLVRYAVSPSQTNLDEVETGSTLSLQRRAHRVSNLTTCCLLLTALSVVGLGIIGGSFLYDQYIKVQRPSRFTGYAQIPYNKDDMLNDDPSYNMETTDQWLAAEFKSPYFQEEFEIDDDYEKIDVPDFKNGRNGRFIHDFNTNTTGIIDITGNRCFVMPLNRENVLPPKSLFDLIHKMWDGYYNVDTKVVRQTMRVVTPAITDPKTIGSYIGRECDGKPIYKLETYIGGVVKRSADLHDEAKFAQFAGKGITEVDIINLEDITEYERH